MLPNKSATVIAATMHHFIWDSSLELNRGRDVGPDSPNNVCLFTSFIELLTMENSRPGWVLPWQRQEPEPSPHVHRR